MPPLTALENAFKVGDVEDRGVVDAGQVQYIVQQVLGDVLTVSEVRTLVQKGEAVGAASTCSNLHSSTLIYTHRLY